MAEAASLQIASPGNQMKTFLKIVAGIAAVIALAAGAAFYFTAGMVDSANAFFDAIKKQDITTARSYLSEDFKASTDETALKAFLSTSALLKFKEAHWSNRQISGGQGNLEGSVVTDSGGTIPLKMTFVKENGQWKIYGIQKPAAGLQIGQSQGVPGIVQQIELVKRSMHDFGLSVNDRNMSHFRDTVSQLWQRQFTTQKFEDAFGGMYGKGAYLNALDSRQPALDPVNSLGENGELILKGSYATAGKPLYFEQKYVYEGTDWKLIGFNFQNSGPY